MFNRFSSPQLALDTLMDMSCVFQAFVWPRVYWSSVRSNLETFSECDLVSGVDCELNFKTKLERYLGRIVKPLAKSRRYTLGLRIGRAADLESVVDGRRLHNFIVWLAILILIFCRPRTN